MITALSTTSFVRWARRKRFRTARPPVGWARFGSLRRTTPVSRYFGLDRGSAIDRHYMDAFLHQHRRDVRGRVLEVGDDRYTVAFGDDRVTTRDVLNAVPGNPRATFVGDLSTGAGLPDHAFDCVILTQVLQYIPDPVAAIAHIQRILAPGGVVLAILPGLAKTDRGHDGSWSDWWRFTERSAAALFHHAFSPDRVETRTYGNVLAVTAALMGLAQEDLRPAELDVHDPDYPLVFAIRATRSEQP